MDLKKTGKGYKNSILRLLLVFSLSLFIGGIFFLIDCHKNGIHHRITKHTGIAKHHLVKFLETQQKIEIPTENLKTNMEVKSAVKSETDPIIEPRETPPTQSAFIPNPIQKSRYAYVTLISGINNKFKYRGFLYNALIMRKVLKDFGSTADFIAMIGYSDADHSPFMGDIDLLKTHGIIVFELPRLLSEQHPLNFAEMALLKITPFSFDQYEKIQFFDGDIMPNRNMDCFFKLKFNSFTIGAVSPLNSGWFLAIPNKTQFDEMREKAIWRLKKDWDMINGWEEVMPKGLERRDGQIIEKWDFNGADMDQGLFLHYFVIHHGNAMLINTQKRTSRVYKEGFIRNSPDLIPLTQSLECCDGKVPTSFFAHFTGRSKPWMNDLTKVHEKNWRNNDKLKWKNNFDSLKLDINSSTLGSLNLGSPLGFFNAGFPKGGYKDKK